MRKTTWLLAFVETAHNVARRGPRVHKAQRTVLRAGLCALIGIAAMPAFAQRNEIIALQRDVAQLEEEVKNLQKANDEKLEQLRALMQQTVDASGKSASSVSALQRSVLDSLTDQQKRILEPLVDLRTKTSQISDDVGAIRENVADLQRRVNAMDSKLNDILTQVRVLATPPAPPPPAAGTPGTPQTSNLPDRITAWENARRDYSGGNDNLAMQELVEYVKNFKDDANAPVAQYYIGMLYDKAGQYDDAAAAFDRVVEQFPTNNKTCESAYRKGDELIKAGKKPEGRRALNDYLMMCPADDRVAQAKHQLSTLSGAPARGAAKKR